MTGLQYAIAAGLMVGAGLWILSWRLAPSYPNLAQTLKMLGPLANVAPEPASAGWEAVGQWGLMVLPEKLRPIPTKDLALLGVRPAGFLARKMAFALVGLLAPGVLGAALILMGTPLSFAVPALVSVAMAVTSFLLPDLEVRARAGRARREFSRNLACFVDLVALERSCGSGTKQALDTAAEVGDSWVFRRLRECLDRSTWAGLSGSEGLRELAGDLDLADLNDVADIIRLSGSEGAGIYPILRARARGIREAILTAELIRANETNEKMSLPVSVLGIIFLAILIGPALLSMMGSLP